MNQPVIPAKGNGHSRESGNPVCKPSFKGKSKDWIPAFAGMTVHFAGMTIGILCTVFFTGVAFSENSPPPLLLLLDRAKTFEECNLLFLAREQYKYILSLYPNEKKCSAALKNLAEKETTEHLTNAVAAREVGALPAALYHVTLALASSPEFPPALEQRKSLLKEIQMRKGLQKKISDDYLQGLRHYQEQQLDRALECFVRVLNMDPNHKAALSYIEKIGSKLDMGPQR